MRTDGIFYDLFLKFPSVFFELMGGSARDAEDYDFTSVEVKELAFRIDGVFEPDEDSDLPIWFVEAQAQPKENLYERLFTEAFIYLRQQRPDRDWRAAVFYLSRSIECLPRHDWYREFFESGRLQRIYLDELPPSTSLGIELARLVVLPPAQVGDRACELLQRSRVEFSEVTRQEEFLKLVVDITIQKFPQKNRQEIEAMLKTGTDAIKHTAFYQDIAGEGRTELQTEAVPRLLALGLEPEQIAEALDMSVEAVREVIAQQEQQER